MVVERREVPPIGIAADQLDDARHEHEAKQQPAGEPDAGGPVEAHDECDDSRLQEECVPLEVHEGLAGMEQREIERIDENEAEARQQIESQQEREDCAAPADSLNGEIAVVQPEHHRREDETLRPETCGKRIGEFMQRQDAAAADESLRLHGEGDEGG